MSDKVYVFPELDQGLVVVLVNSNPSITTEFNSAEAGGPYCYDVRSDWCGGLKMTGTQAVALRDKLLEAFPIPVPARDPGPPPTPAPRVPADADALREIAVMAVRKLST